MIVVGVYDKARVFHLIASQITVNEKEEDYFLIL